ncbi:MAG: hypothetical protein KC435_01895 [Thermomicrobiales bacterium]|nr:hypothetical protein [Thermomicrobiales bacterium]
MEDLGQIIGALVLAVMLAVFGGNGDEVTRTSRSGSKILATEVVETGIQPGAWKIEGETSWDYVNFEIAADDGTNAEIIASVDADDLAVQVGYPLIGETETAAGCRMFIFSGPMNVGIQVFFCTGNGYVMWGTATDRDIADQIVEAFVANEPFIVPAGWHEVGE